MKKIIQFSGVTTKKANLDKVRFMIVNYGH